MDQILNKATEKVYTQLCDIVTNSENYKKDDYNPNLAQMVLRFAASLHPDDKDSQVFAIEDMFVEKANSAFLIDEVMPMKGDGEAKLTLLGSLLRELNSTFFALKKTVTFINECSAGNYTNWQEEFNNKDNDVEELLKIKEQCKTKAA